MYVVLFHFCGSVRFSFGGRGRGWGRYVRSWADCWISVGETNGRGRGNCKADE